MVKITNYKLQITNFFILLAVILSLMPVQPAMAAGPGTVIVKFKGSHVSDPLNAERLFDNVYRVSVADVDSALVRFRFDPNVEYAEPDGVVRAQTPANDPYFTTDTTDLTKQWYLPKLEVPQAWDKTKGNNVIVAVIDTGIDGRHADLNDGRVLPGYMSYCFSWLTTFINGKESKTACLGNTSGNIAAGANSDDNGHGTVVAGVIGAIPNNSQAVAGINWNVRLMPIKVLDNAGDGVESDAAVGIRWAADNGAKIINLSLGSQPMPAGSSVIQDAISYAFNKGILVIAAAGNDAADDGGDLNKAPVFPVCADGGANMVIGVAATDVADRKARFSNYGSNCVDISAPGAGTFISRDDRAGLIVARYNPAFPAEHNRVAAALGTSVAAPMVSGVAALMMSVFPDLSLTALRDRLLASVDNIDIFNTAGCGGASCMGQIGRGRINAFKAVNAAGGFGTGSLLAGADGRKFLIEAGVKRPVSEFVYGQRFAGTAPITVTAAELNSYPVGLPLPPADGTLVKSPENPLVYVVEGGLLRPISYLAFVSRGFRFENILVLSAAEIAIYRPGDEALVQNGVLMKSRNHPAVYLLNNGIRQLVSWLVYKQRGLDRQPMAVLPEDEVTRFALSTWLYPPVDSTLLVGDRSPTVYVIEGGRRHGLNLAAFQARGYRFEDVRVVAQSETEGYEPGADMIQ